MGFRVWGSAFGVQGLGFRVWGSGFGVQGLIPLASACARVLAVPPPFAPLRFRVKSLELRVLV